MLLVQYNGGEDTVGIDWIVVEVSSQGVLCHSCVSQCSIRACLKAKRAWRGDKAPFWPASPFPPCGPYIGANDGLTRGRGGSRFTRHDVGAVVDASPQRTINNC